jgi:hypothetical protein
MPSIVSLTRFIAELGLSLNLSQEVIATSFVYLHTAVKELSLTQLGSDAVALAAAAVMLAAKTKEAAIKPNDIAEIAVKLATDKPTLSVEAFAERKKILKDKAGFFETLIIRLQPLDFDLGFYYLTGICAEQNILHVANQLLFDFYRSSGVAGVSPTDLAEGAAVFAKAVLGTDPVKPEIFSQYPWLTDVLEDIYT